MDSRPAKPHGHTPERLHQWWDGRLEALGFEPERLLAGMLGRQRRRVGLDAAWGRPVGGPSPRLADGAAVDVATR